MSGYFFLIPISLLLGTVGLFAFVWNLKHGQYDDLEGAAHRILPDDDVPLPDASRPRDGDG